MIHEILRKGEGNATTGQQLAGILRQDIRTITAQIERERRQGYAICANSRGKFAGYYLAENPAELRSYCKELQDRASEMLATHKALLSILENMEKKAI